MYNSESIAQMVPSNSTVGNCFKNASYIAQSAWDEKYWSSYVERMDDDLSIEQQNDTDTLCENHETLLNYSWRSKNRILFDIPPNETMDITNMWLVIELTDWNQSIMEDLLQVTLCLEIGGMQISKVNLLFNLLVEDLLKRRPIETDNQVMIPVWLPQRYIMLHMMTYQECKIRVDQYAIENDCHLIYDYVTPLEQVYPLNINTTQTQELTLDYYANGDVIALDFDSIVKVFVISFVEDSSDVTQVELYLNDGNPIVWNSGQLKKKYIRDRVNYLLPLCPCFNDLFSILTSNKINEYGINFNSIRNKHIRIYTSSDTQLTDLQITGITLNQIRYIGGLTGMALKF